MTGIDYAPLGITTSSGAELYGCGACGSVTANRELHSRSHGDTQTFETVPEQLPGSGEDSAPE